MEQARKFKPERPVVFFDIESTGLDTYEDRIVELAMVKVHPDGKEEQFEKRFNPQKPISKEATEVHGITDYEVSVCRPFSAYAFDVAEFFLGCDIGGYNVRHFDLPMLMNELGRSDQSITFPVHIIDCCEVFHQKEPRDLVSAVKFYCGRDFEKAHAALEDVLATIDVLDGQIKRYGDMSTTAEGIHDEFTDPAAVDVAGKLKRQDDKTIVLTFGKYQGQPIFGLPISYLQWMKKNHVLGPDAEQFVNAAIGGHYARGRGRG